MDDHPEPQTRVSITLPDSMWREIREWQISERIATKAEAVRRLLQNSLRRARKSAVPGPGRKAVRDARMSPEHDDLNKLTEDDDGGE